MLERIGRRCEWLDVRQPDGRCRELFGPKGEGMDACHVQALGMGRSRYDWANPLNGLDNLLGLCRRHHEQMERERLLDNWNQKTKPH